MPRMNSSIDLSPHRPAIEPGQIDDLRRRLFGGESAGPSVPGYELEHELGRGAFGRVYRAFDPRFARTVAVKVVPVRSTAARVRIEREAHALARLSHPNVVQVYDKGPAGDDAYFLALEYIEGPSLEDWLEQEPRSVDQILAKFLDVAKGLAAAHEADLVHRDFKPANAIVGLDQRVRVLDFGLVRALDDSQASSPRSSVENAANDGGPHWSSSDPSTPDDDPTLQPVVTGGPSRPRGSKELERRLTAVGRFVGTPFYAAPEQYEGLADARSDQFSFFVALFEALYDRRPYRLRRRGKSWVRFANTTVRFGKGPRRVPRWLVRMLRRGLDIDPARRFASMDAVVEQLHHRVHRHPWLVRTAMLAGSATVVTASLMGALGVLGGGDLERCRAEHDAWPAAWVEHSATVRAQSPALAASLDDYADRWQQGSSAACHVESAHERAKVESCLDQGAQRLSALVGSLASADHHQWDGLRTHPGPQPLAGLTATLPDPARCVSGDEPRTSENHDRAWRSLLASRTHLEDGALDEAAHEAETVIEHARRLGDRSLRVAGEYQRLQIDIRRGHPHELSSVLSLLAMALDAGERTLAADIAATSMPLVAGGAIGLTARANTSTRSEQINRLADELAAMRSAEAEHPMDPAVNGWLRYAEGHALHELGDLVGARAQYREAKALLTRADPAVPEHLLAVVDLHEAIAMGTQQPPIHSAPSLAVRALQARRAGLGSEHSFLASELRIAGQLHVYAGDIEGALRHYREASRVATANELPLEPLFVRAEIVHAHWLGAHRARARAKQLEAEGSDAQAEWATFEHRRHLSLNEALELERLLPPSLLSSSDTVPVRADQQARLWNVLMHSYLHHPGCWDEAMAAGNHIERTCTYLDGDDQSCIEGRGTLQKMLAAGITPSKTAGRCETDPARLVPPSRPSERIHDRLK